MGKPDPGAIAAQNKRKIEKDKRRKQYHDIQVQGTNNSSIVSKRSVEVLYNPIVEPGTKEWFKYFVPKGKRRSPAINRGYWLRMESIKQAVLRILAAHGGKVRVVNLGCGFDPFPFQMLAESSIEFEFYDFDYPELVQKKMGLINASNEILNVIGPLKEWTEEAKQMGVIMATEVYTLVGCDLNNCELYKKQLNTLLKSNESPVIFIAEVSLAYMKPEYANPVIEILSLLPNSHILVLEQIMPSGDRHFFAKKMLYHFNHLTSPLQCVETYSTKEKQKCRFQKYFPLVEIVDLFESWGQLVSTEKKLLVDSVEEFDEWEEFIVFCQHYVVIHATNNSKQIFEPIELVSLPLVSCEIPMKQIGALVLKFPAACEGKEGVYVNGGLFQTRVDTTLLIQSQDIKEVTVSKRPLPRMCHSMTNLGNGNKLLVGGRTRPGFNLDDIWVFNEDMSTWSMVGSLDYGVSRHSVVALNDKDALLFANGRFEMISIKSEDEKLLFSKTRLITKGSEIQSLNSCGMVYNPERNEGYIVGGIGSNLEPLFNQDLIKFSLNGEEVLVEIVLLSPHFARLGCMLKQVDDRLIIIGGVGPIPQNQDTVVVEFNLLSKEFKGLRVSDLAWSTAPVFIGSQLAGNTIVGGGAVCYSFGSHYNGVYSVDFDGEN